MSTAYHKLPGYWFWGGVDFLRSTDTDHHAEVRLLEFSVKTPKQNGTSFERSKGPNSGLEILWLENSNPPRQIAQFSRSFQPNPGPVAGEHLLGVNSLSQLPQSQSCGEPCA